MWASVAAFVGSRAQAQGAVARGPSCCAACGILPDYGQNWCSPALAGRLLTTLPAGKSDNVFLILGKNSSKV